MTDTSTDPVKDADRFASADLWYAVAMFAAASVAVAYAIERQGGVLLAQSPADALFFLVYGLVTIAIGYPHPNFGYYSFDRVAQVASILVLGPVDAAWINALASLLYPWHRLWKGTAFSDVLVASLNNSGMMALMILLSGSLYAALGGPFPLTSLTPRVVLLLCVLVVVMQVLNELAMLGLLKVSGASPANFFNLFSMALELGSSLTAVLVAIGYDAMDRSVFVLMLTVLTLGMLALRQFAYMRHRLELLVEERTQDLREKSMELERQATQDTLTGLYNRRYADEYLERQVQTGRRRQQRFVVAFADIDLFKRINDRHSHATGDHVLRRVADILRARCRKTDMIARYGGEEFLLCFPDTELDAALNLCEELRAAIELEDWSPFGLGDAVTLSLGIAAYRPDSTAESLLGTADLHLYSAKRRGRNRVVA